MQGNAIARQMRDLRHTRTKSKAKKQRKSYKTKENALQNTYKDKKEVKNKSFIKNISYISQLASFWKSKNESNLMEMYTRTMQNYLASQKWKKVKVGQKISIVLTTLGS